MAQNVGITDIIYTMEEYNLRLFFLFTTANLIPLQFLFHITTSILITVNKSCFVILISHRKNSFKWFYHPTYFMIFSNLISVIINSILIQHCKIIIILI